MVEAALNAAAEQVLEYGAYGARLDARRQPRPGRRRRRTSTPAAATSAGSRSRSPTDAQWQRAASRCWAIPPGRATRRSRPPPDGARAHDAIDAALAAWCADAGRRRGSPRRCSARGIPAAPVVSAARLDRQPAAARARLLRGGRAPGRRHARAPGPADALRLANAERWYRAPGADARRAHRGGPARAARARRRRDRAAARRRHHRHAPARRIRPVALAAAGEPPALPAGELDAARCMKAVAGSAGGSPAALARFDYGQRAADALSASAHRHQS